MHPEAHQELEQERVSALVLVLAVDHFLDMGRTATNVVGNAVASAVVAKWEGGFDPEKPVVD